MRTLSNDEYAKKVLEITGKAKPFEPEAYYDPDGDCIEFIVKPDNFYAERVDDLLTVYYSEKTKEIIGCLIKGVSSFCKHLMKKLPGFAFDIEAGRVRLGLLLRAWVWSELSKDDKILVLTYKKLADSADEMNVETELCSLT
jgi:hypothetical protein